MKSCKKYLLLIFFIFNLNGLYSQIPDSTNPSLSSNKYSNDTICAKDNLESLYQLKSYEEAVVKAQQYVDSAILTNDSTQIANMLLILGIMQENKGDNTIAFETLLDAYTIFKSIHNRIGTAIAMDHLGTIFRYHGSQQKSLEYHTKAYQIFMQGNHSFGLINVLNNLGIINRQLGNDKKAFEYHKKALDLAIKNKSSNLSSIYISIGTYYWYSGVNDSALYYYKLALNIPPENLLLKERHCAALNNIGNVYRSILQYDSALYYYNLAIEESRLYQTKNLEAVNLKNIGRIYALTSKYDKAYDFYQRSLEIATEVNLKKVILENYSWLGELFEKQQDYKNALIYFKKHAEIGNVILAEKQLAEINQLERDFSIEQADKRHALKLKEKTEKNLLLQKRRTLETFYLALLLIFLSSSLFIFFLYRTKKKSHLQLLKLNEELEIKVKERTKSLFKAKEKAEESEAKFRKLSANVPDLIFQFTRRPDGSYYVPIASAGIKNVFGCSPEDVFNNFEPIARVIHPEDASRVIDDIEYSATHMTYFTCEFRVQISGRETQWIFSRSTPEKLEDGSITWYGFNVNITERKKIEEELIKAKKKAEESDRLKMAFLANMSHEIRTPMNAILGFSSLLLESDLSGEDQHEFFEVIQRSSNRLLSTLNDIVDISKIESGQVEVLVSEVNINEQLKYFYSVFKPEATNKGIKLSFNNNLPEQDIIIKTDLEKFNSILMNLIKNAVKYTKQGSIELGCNIKREKESNELEFYIKDTGIGIPIDRQAAIFERFIQADIEDKNAMDGSGLGLAISKAYAEMLGGNLRLESEEGVGSTFYFSLNTLL